ncbi:alpha/beta hydrolase family protein [Alteriqipengyuania lutimaris]|uniref:Alpha/beta hydrolase n=1 Tax=Alteriqipengyuania lutimaris TaxID=1538146 RepID=A0A395LV16_9SPHN|nr:alpha/beta hydrolase [Alteriqipengyuania lutimaris]MBB3032634.1 dienelactone hydrolase [Alteriqipengyuania lutimaris]RDS78250.1 alpha/beta hydrolase [Alteriqipengyuania lutimaris]
MRWTGLWLALLVFAPPQSLLARDLIHEERSIPATDERPITFYVDRPATDGKLPLLLIVDGSGCAGQMRESSWGNYAPGAEDPVPYARVMVEKPGVAATTPQGAECTPTFDRYYTIQNRVLDHLRVLQHLGANADWWNGQIFIWSWSDGGDVAAQILTYRPDIDRAVLGAMGGGLTMAEHFERFWACPEDMPGDREACLADLRSDFAAIEASPNGTDKWNGESYATWASRLRTRLSAALIDNRVSILIVHGDRDFENTPVESARQLVADLEAAGNPAFTYWEVRGMEHGWRNLPKARQKALVDAMLGWVLTGEVDGDQVRLAVEGE